ncbi:helix-turn-helix domain-containing protein [Leptobacterium flavescens]|uniref:Helix-turn-helix domain-containing protein n=1 Tax=Leptobacterium flavescens TaxID=472055 RepID=A0A6P0UF83_9FLAO|nr:AraC family transcriptional regulator [Leptobacterium flavescens]NER11931.1 helix-turn-helix domain-containing protein [Leptobacterium flavescens]
MKLAVNNQQGPDTFFKELSKQLSATIEDGLFKVPRQYGDGYASFQQLEKGLFFSIYNLKLHQDFEHDREAADSIKYYTLSCSYSDQNIQKWSDNKWININKHSPNGLFLISPRIETKFKVHANTPIFSLVITFSKDWLASLSCDKENPTTVLKYIQSKKPFCFYESISFELESILEHIIAENNKATPSLILLKGFILQFLGNFIERIESRDQNIVFKNINQQDITLIFKAKQQIQDNYRDIPKIESLATEIGMSVSKLQKLFKHIVGMSIYKYALKVRLKEAKKLLDTGKYSISEVGYKIGYSNLSHFTDKFRKHFGMNPKAYLNKK